MYMIIDREAGDIIRLVPSVRSSVCGRSKFEVKVKNIKKINDCTDKWTLLSILSPSYVVDNYGTKNITSIVKSYHQV